MKVGGGVCGCGCGGGGGGGGGGNKIMLFYKQITWVASISSSE